MLKSSVCVIMNKIISNIYLHYNQHSRDRAIILLKSSSIEYSTIEYRKYVPHLNKAQYILLFRTNILPFMKSKIKNETIENPFNKDNEYYTAF